jgi:hypothetical protein
MYWIERQIFLFDFFGILDFLHAMEARSRILEWFGTRSSDIFWMNYWWMNFKILIFHPWIVHALIVEWSCILCSWNALWVAYRMECLFVADGMFVCDSQWATYGWYLNILNFIRWLCMHGKPNVEIQYVFGIRIEWPTIWCNL